MKEYEPYAYAAPKVNIRTRYDFDSDKPLDGEQQKADYSAAWGFTIEYTAAIVVVLAGWRLCEWWYYGGYMLMRKSFVYFLPWLMRMIETGSTY